MQVNNDGNSWVAAAMTCINASTAPGVQAVSPVQNRDVAMLSVEFPDRQLPGELRATLARALTEVLLVVYGGRTAAALCMATIRLQPVPEGQWWVGGRADDGFVAPTGSFVARLNVPAGFLSPAQKRYLHDAITDTIVRVAGAQQAFRGSSIVVLIDEVPDGNGAWAGQPRDLDDFARMLGLDGDG